MKQLLTCLTSIFFISTTCGCAPYRPDTEKAGYCNQLNSEVIFSGNTSNIRNANIENANEPLVQRTYDRKCE